MNTNTKEHAAYYATYLLAGGFFIWWLLNFLTGQPGDKSLDFYSDSYWLAGLVGAICGFYAAKEWGGLKSVFGRALSLFSLGLLAQVFGQLTYTYYAYIRDIEAPYPSIGDIGFFGSVLLYIAGVFILSKAVGARFKFASIPQKFIALLVPLGLLITSYYFFIKGYEVGDDKLVTFLDFGYPLGQALYISLALLIYILSLKLLGGKMKNMILLLLLALLIQYLADFTFLYRFAHEQWYAGDISELLYQVAYFVMAIALLKIGGVARQLRSGKAE